MNINATSFIDAYQIQLQISLILQYTI